MKYKELTLEQLKLILRHDMEQDGIDPKTVQDAVDTVTMEQMVKNVGEDEVSEDHLAIIELVEEGKGGPYCIVTGSFGDDLRVHLDTNGRPFLLRGFAEAAAESSEFRDQAWFIAPIAPVKMV